MVSPTKILVVVLGRRLLERRNRAGEYVRPILVGMNNPLGADPRHVLFPAPEGCSGYRLWRMLHEVCGATRVDYRDGFDRRNLVVGTWHANAAKDGAARLREEVEGVPPPRPGGRLPTVVALGREVARALDLPEEAGLVLPLVRDGVAWRQVPHPSGRNPWYNEPAHRMMVGLLLEELLHG